MNKNNSIESNLRVVGEPDLFSRKEKLYLEVRGKEGRLFSDELLNALPELPASHPLAKEWKIRKHSLQILQDYLRSKSGPLNILDLGCGNGWMSAALAQSGRDEVTGLDVNMEELEQGARVFRHVKNLSFIYGDIMADYWPASSFDVVIMASSAQYFENLPRLLKRVQELVKHGGEIHILDTPFYEAGGIAGAVDRSQLYYENLGYPEMHQHYHHHLLSALQAFKAVKMNTPSLMDKIKNRLFDKTTSFQWYKIPKS